MRTRARSDRATRRARASTSSRITPEIPEITRTSAADIARALLAGAESVQRIDAYLVRAEAAALAYIADGNRAQVLGAPSVSRVADEILRIGKRTAFERISLHRIFVLSSTAERAFLDGRLSACQVLALGPVFRRTREDHGRWIDESSGLPVRQIRARVRAYLASRVEIEQPDEQEPEGAAFCFTAPIPFKTAWNETMDLSRRVLGYDAPQYRCVEAILAEAGISGAGEADIDGETPGAGTPIDPRPVAGGPGGRVSDRGDRRAPGCIANHLAASGVVPFTKHALRDRFISPNALALAKETLNILDRHMRDIREFADRTTPADPFEALDHLRQIHALRAPLRSILGRILRAMRDTRVLDYLGYRHVRELAELHLKFSERTARSLVQESYMFEDSPPIEDAYGCGEIGVGKAFLVRRIATSGRTTEFIRRAREVTLSQFRRECRFLELLRLTDRRLAARFSDPLPCPGLEQALAETLCESHGYTHEKIAAAFASRGLQSCSGASVDGSVPDDPAADPILMERLELLLDLLVMTRWDDLPASWRDLPEHERQLSALPAGTALIRFWAPRTVIADLRTAINRIRRDHGVAIPVWVALVVLFRDAEKQWNQQDPTTRPTHEKILRRDRYHCRSPLCDCRSRLEVHHVRFVSRGGTNEPANLLSLCHTDHRHVIHAGHARLRGLAPRSMRWEIGLRPGREPLLVLIGSRIVGGSCA